MSALAPSRRICEPEEELEQTARSSSTPRRRRLTTAFWFRSRRAPGQRARRRADEVAHRFRSGRSIIRPPQTGWASPAIRSATSRCGRRAWATRCASRPRWRRWWTFYTGVLGLQLSTAAGIVPSCAAGAATIISSLYQVGPSRLPPRELRVGNVDEIGMGGVQAARQGLQGRLGFGRHVIGSNFLPLHPRSLDSMAEYSATSTTSGGFDWKATTTRRKTLSTSGGSQAPGGLWHEFRSGLEAS